MYEEIQKILDPQYRSPYHFLRTVYSKHSTLITERVEGVLVICCQFGPEKRYFK